MVVPVVLAATATRRLPGPVEAARSAVTVASAAPAVLRHRATRAMVESAVTPETVGTVARARPAAETAVRALPVVMPEPAVPAAHLPSA